VFNELDVDGFFCEWDDERSGRIEAASRFLDADQLCLSLQCGFSSTKEVWGSQ
jgi:5-methyltetrahydropteroyltriglutamate--homocysteine methyltransferase